MRRLVLVGAVGILAFTSCSPVCERAGNRINNFTRGNDVMAEPAAKLKEKPSEPEKKQESALAIERPALFKPTFTFDTGDKLYEDGKGNAQVRKGKEIIYKGKVLDKGKEGFVFLTDDNYEIVFHKSGVRNTTATPDEIRDRSIKSR